MSRPTILIWIQMHFPNTLTLSRIWRWNIKLMSPKNTKAITLPRFSSNPSSVTCSRWSLASSSSHLSRRLRIFTRLSLKLKHRQLWFKRGCRPWLTEWATVNYRQHWVIIRNRHQDQAYHLVEWPSSVSKCNKPPKLFNFIPKCTLPPHNLLTRRLFFRRLPPEPPT